MNALEVTCLARALGDILDMHLNVPGIDRRKVERLAEALRHPRERDEAAEAIVRSRDARLDLETHLPRHNPVLKGKFTFQITLLNKAKSG